ncbi:ATP-dependent helicase [Crocosphaera sp. XPORK-15E]|uniref:ATP-dependent helicase n=1 Tax=Crocosphaera sp. XPORK-15E TaxID=3110247 RepID=UPI002B1FEE37|nr:ATP-dependent helicase [Crocosphaera sp. XPORK-15E]MEA5533068.1 ATP-dependent helicase [Crocosphaera sp. XPORK-15E]
MNDKITTEEDYQLKKLRDNLRPGQQQLADWEGGKMAVSAVPGAGKSHSLSVAAAMTIARYQLHPRKQLIIVTYTRSAAAGIKAKIKERLKELKRPQTGFMVQTLHGLALNIASRHPELSQLNLDTSTVIIPTPSHRVIRTCVEKWINLNPRRYQILLEGFEFDGEETERLRRQSVLRTEVLPQLAYTIIREAKSSGLTAEQVWELSHFTPDNYDILAIAAGLYEQYQIVMRSLDFIDYDDMILGALNVLNNAQIRQMWQQQVFAVFEDEAQDSSPLQEKLISVLAAQENNLNDEPNLIRVGDPNQAINSTFTPADPVYFNWFCETCKNQDKLAVMNQAGRSSLIIIEAANFVLQWVNKQWKLDELKRKENHLIETSQETKKEVIPFRLQNIKPVDKSDPQPNANPDPVGEGLELYQPDDIYHTVDLIRQRVIELLTKNPEHNAAILVRENRQGRFIAESLKELYKDHKIRVYEVGESERFSQIPQEILKLLQFMERPHSPDYLKSALEILQKRGLIDTQDLNALSTYPENFLYPTPLIPEQKKQVLEARKYCCNLLQAKLELPDYQLIPFLGMTLKYTGAELATVQKLSERIAQELIGKNSLKTIINTLKNIVNSEQFEGVEEDNDDRYTRANQVTIITMHKSKGLDWDYVFLPFLHEDVLPGKPWVPVSSQFLGNFTLGEVSRAQIRAAVHSQYINPEETPNIPQPLDAWEEAQQLKKAEEFRLLYVAMTRAKRLLWMSAAKQGPFRWSVFKGDGTVNLQAKIPCPILPILMERFTQSVIEYLF